jgi:hypothetical protein
MHKAGNHGCISRQPRPGNYEWCTVLHTNTRTSENLFDYLEGASTLEDFLEDFPSVSHDKAIAVLESARERLAADAPAA